MVTLSQEKKLRKTRRFTSVAVAAAVLISSIGLVFYNYNKQVQQSNLKPATISVWYAADEVSLEHDAMQFIVDDFKKAFPDVTIDLRAISNENYAAEIEEAAQHGDLPDLFESTDLSDSVLENAQSVEKLLKTEQAKACLFLDQYHAYYNDTKRLPLAIEVPVAYVITAGNTAIAYDGKYVSDIADFDVAESDIAADARYEELVRNNFGDGDYADISAFMDNAGNTSPVLLSSTMIVSEFNETMGGYGKECVFYDADEIYCDYTYEWSIGSESGNELAAAECFLSWMLGNPYQSALMITKNYEGQIPLNKTSFNTKIESQYLAPIREIYERFVFDAEK